MQRRLVANSVLPGLKNNQLKLLAFHAGLPLTGTKPVLSSQIYDAVNKPQLTGHDAYRLISIDMGIRNLAYCILDVKDQSLKQSSSTQVDVINQGPESLFEELTQRQGNTVSLINVSKWTRIEVASKGQFKPALSDDTGDKLEKNSKISNDAFTPLQMAPLAYDLVMNYFLPHAPTHILIERQRHRSGGASAVLEWTFRVNMLESMIYAILFALGRTQKAPTVNPSVIPMDPKRVDNYWTSADYLATISRDLSVGQKSMANLKRPRGSKAEKVDRISVARSWLESLRLNTESEAGEARSLLLEGRKQRTKKLQMEGENGLGSRKMDDLADCLLQGVAFIEWEVNRRRIGNALAFDPRSNKG